MDDFNSDGGVICSGTIHASSDYIPIYEIRDILYDRIEAYFGFIDKIVIKKVIIPDDPVGGKKPYAIYVDTLNGLHYEEDLITYEQAIEIVQSLTS